MKRSLFSALLLGTLLTFPLVACSSTSKSSDPAASDTEVKEPAPDSAATDTDAVTKPEESK